MNTIMHVLVLYSIAAHTLRKVIAHTLQKQALFHCGVRPGLVLFA